MSGMGLTEILFRLIVSSIFRGCIGLERELKNKSAGFVTLILVCLGATTIALLQEELLIRQISLISTHPSLIESYKLDITRLSAQVVTGVGFIGGGVIVYSNDKISGDNNSSYLVDNGGYWLSYWIWFRISIYSSFFIVVITLIVMKILERKVITMVRNNKATRNRLVKKE